MATLTQQEQERIGRFEELQRQRATGERLVSDAMLEEAERLAGFARLNAQARERAQQQQQERIAAEQAAQKQRMDQAATKAQEAYMARRRFEWRGTEEQWQQMKGRILEEYLLGGGDESEQRRLAQTVRF